MASDRDPSALAGRGFAARTAGGALLIQAVVVSVLVSGFAASGGPGPIPVVTTVGSAAFTVTRVDLGVGVVVPLVLGAVLLLTGAGSDRRLPWLRWLESSLSASITVFLIAELNGIREVGTLVGIYALTSAAVLFGAVQEGRTEVPRRMPAIFGAMVGIVPWGLIAWYQIVPLVVGDSGPAIWVRILTLIVLGLFVVAATLTWRGAGASGLALAVSVATRSMLAWTVAVALLGGLRLT